MKYQHEELIQNTQQRIEDLEFNLYDLQYDLQTKDRMIQNLESQHKEFIKNTEQKLGMMKETEDKADSEVVNPDRPGECWSNIPLLFLIIILIIPFFWNIPVDSIIEFDEYHEYLQLNTEVSFHGYFAVYKLEESRDWFITKIRYVNGGWVFYIMHHSEEKTKDVFYYSIIYDLGSFAVKFPRVRCAPMGKLPKDAEQNKFATFKYPVNVIFTIYKD